MIVTETLRIRVYGVPAPKGSKRAFVVKGRAVVVDANAKTKPWEEAVKQAARDAMPEGFVPLDEPLHIETTYYLPRPSSLPKRVLLPYKKPDLDKLDRAIWDALTAASVWRDDSLVCDSLSFKRYVSEDSPTGAAIDIFPCLKV